MKDYKLVWKSLSKEKKITSTDVYIYCLLKAITAKNPEKQIVARGLLQRSFTPTTRPSKLANGRQPYSAVVQASYRAGHREKDLIGPDKQPTRLIECLDTPEEIAMYKELDNNVIKSMNDHLDDLYTFIFVRQDLTKEQQVVQSSHATLVLGTKLKDADPHKLNFVVCGAKDLNDLVDIKEYINSYGIETVHFTEPDINNELTAIASHPMGVLKKRIMKKFKLLTLN